MINNYNPKNVDSFYALFSNIDSNMDKFSELAGKKMSKFDPDFKAHFKSLNDLHSSLSNDQNAIHEMVRNFESFAKQEQEEDAHAQSNLKKHISAIEAKIDQVVKSMSDVEKILRFPPK